MYYFSVKFVLIGISFQKMVENTSQESTDKPESKKAMKKDAKKAEKAAKKAEHKAHGEQNQKTIVEEGLFITIYKNKK